MPVTVSSSGTNLIHQISNSNYKQSIGAGDKGSFDLTVTINATLKDRMAWKKPNKEDRATIANTFLNALKMAADTGALGPNSGKVSEKDYAKLFKQLSKEGLTIRSAKKIISNLAAGRTITRYHPFKALAKVIELAGLNPFRRIEAKKDVQQFEQQQFDPKKGF
jgi:Asp-tRNA(Asn)/Glu-tRNA(Gln) amidotransferase B subunit